MGIYDVSSENCRPVNVGGDDDDNDDEIMMGIVVESHNVLLLGGREYDSILSLRGWMRE